MIIFSIALSEQCNLNCSYCNVDKQSQKKISAPKFLGEYAKLREKVGNEKIQIDFFGGEPLLQWDTIVAVVEELKDDPNCQFFMPTNGLLLTEDKIDYLNRNKVQVSLSFDGLWQDTNRKQHNNRGTLRLYLDKADLFKKVHNLECHTMIYKGNFDLLDNQLFIQEKFGVNTQLTLVRDVDVWDEESIQMLKYGFSELVDWYIANSKIVEMPNMMLEYLRHMLLYTTKGRETNFCGAGESYFSFSENETLPCNRFQEKEHLAAIEDYKRMTPCQTCEVRQYCKKGCLFENIKNQGPIIELCDMYKHIYAELQRMTKELCHESAFRELMAKEAYEA